MKLFNKLLFLSLSKDKYNIFLKMCQVILHKNFCGVVNCKIVETIVTKL
ncbi:hypothetical protein [Enterococcus phage vB_Efs10_KEN05]